MTLYNVRQAASSRRVILAAALLALPACKDADLGPNHTGNIEGQVVDFETGQSIPGASITTTPPTDAIITNGEGRFVIDELEVGNYQITARKSGYTGASVAVAVRQNRTSSAVIFLEKKDDDEDAPPDLDVSIIAWWQERTSPDSTFVEAEYRVRNPGPTAVTRYEVYFRITTDQNDFFHEAGGDGLQPSQSDVRRFRTFIVDRNATDVIVDDLWVEG